MLEIERKFLVVGDGWRAQATRHSRMQQGYFPGTKGYTLRVRLVDDSQAFLTIKAQGADALARLEFEYPVPVNDARLMLRVFCIGRTLSKTRHYLDFGGFTWEVDEFDGDNAGLVVAEIELPTKTTDFTRPEWLGDEVTADFRYRNANLVRQPYTHWERPDNASEPHAN